ncbi:MAG: hypothetical protein ACF8LL_10825, partial [Phycisphaerales bacterium]
TIVWAEAVYQLVTGGVWQPLPLVPVEPTPRWARHPTWTHGVGRRIRLWIRGNPACTRMELRDQFYFDEGGGCIADYMAFLTKPGGNGTSYSAFSLGKGNRGYYMSEAAYKRWTRYDDIRRIAYYAEWIEEQRWEGTLPFGYEDDE